MNPSSAPSDNPSTTPSDIPSSLPSKMPSAQPSDMPSVMPSDEPTAMPSDVPSEEPSAMPVVPVPDDAQDVTEESTLVPIGPDQAPQDQQVLANQPLELDSILQVDEGTAPIRDSRGVCIKDGVERTVSVDLRSAFPDQLIVTCTEEEDHSIMDRLENALNAAFPYVASDWDGKAVFNEFDFDFNQEKANVGGFRRHRDLRILQTQICPSRSAACPSFYDSCRLSCGLLATTNCNGDGMDLDSIDQLENYLSAAVTASLRSLHLDCLGFTSELVALVRIANVNGP